LSKQTPIQSMTGFAAVTRDLDASRLHIELRGVNARFLDLQMRMPDELRAAEPALRELLSAGIVRGKVECRIALLHAAAESRQPAIDRGLLARLLTAAAEIEALAPTARGLSVADLMRWPGVIVEPTTDPDAMHWGLLAAAGEALAQFVATRAREGGRLAREIGERAARMRVLVAQAQSQAPALLAAFETKLVERLRSALTDAASGGPLPLEQAMERVRQEVALHGLRIDVDEELSRLRTHLDELDRVLAAGGAAGKRLDFLMQELNREANTLGSKGASIDLTAIVMELKLLVEQIREQVQNIE
jgi:uncharacterized protein (TIGR00255 family)